MRLPHVVGPMLAAYLLIIALSLALLGCSHRAGVITPVGGVETTITVTPPRG